MRNYIYNCVYIYIYNIELYIYKIIYETVFIIKLYINLLKCKLYL